MEDRLKNLIEGNNEANRTKWAKEWKKQDKKIIGVMSSYVPEEIISAAGMLPFRITGTWREDISHARVYRVMVVVLSVTMRWNPFLMAIWNFWMELLLVSKIKNCCVYGMY